MQLLADSGNIWQRLYNCLLIRNTGQVKMTPENKNRKRAPRLHVHRFPVMHWKPLDEATSPLTDLAGLPGDPGNFSSSACSITIYTYFRHLFKQPEILAAMVVKGNAISGSFYVPHSEDRAKALSTGTLCEPCRAGRRWHGGWGAQCVAGPREAPVSYLCSLNPPSDDLAQEPRSRACFHRSSGAARTPAIAGQGRNRQTRGTNLPDAHSSSLSGSTEA